MKVLWQAHRYQDDLAPGGTKAAADWLALQIQSLIPPGIDPQRAGLYVATADSAADTAVGFWQEALTEGPDFVNPRDFPWTLASSVATHAACQAHLQGPCYTLVGGADAMIGAITHAIDDLRSDSIELAVVAGIDPNGGHNPHHCAAGAVASLARGDTAGLASVTFAADSGLAVSADFAPRFLMRLCQAIEQRQNLTLGIQGEGFVCLTWPC